MFSTHGIANLSAGGAFVLTSVTAPERLLGRPVNIEFRLDGGSAEWIAASGEIVRVRNAGVAIAFETVSERVAGMLSELEMASRDLASACSPWSCSTRARSDAGSWPTASRVPAAR